MLPPEALVLLVLLAPLALVPALAMVPLLAHSASLMLPS